MEREISYSSSTTLEAEDFSVGSQREQQEKAPQVPAPAEVANNNTQNERYLYQRERERVKGQTRGRERRGEKRPNDRPGPRGSLDRPNVFRSFGIPPRAARQMGIRKLLWIFWIFAPRNEG